MKHLYFLLALLFTSFSSVVFAQTQDLNSDSGKFNLPPGYRMPLKMKVYDLSHKLTGKLSEEKYTSEDLKFLKRISDEELEKYKDQAPDYYNYYKKGTDFINSLSSKVKSIYSKEELWYIYAFDQKLKNKLTTIK
ncbi:hypothetical protein [Flavobacterium suncheonense]|uniref:Secreted protein n=1 Tax=Flavobacterium suncheonense GH29-5 = DSM 17707 TaxID=1121899 RepID=A0A0A2MP60_9FLAO|nr:hypothetical protein [Flavobacterium suncheonense]KGO90065.1 hypothetical protein Q764_03080 [Flavobacterium suncheonense GH29-5 = DSM 17707]